MISRTAVHSKRWLTTAAAGLMLAGAAASAQVQSSGAAAPAAPHAASGEPRMVNPAPGRPIPTGTASTPAVRPAQNRGSLLSLLFGSDERHTRQTVVRQPTAQSRTATARPTGARHANYQVVDGTIGYVQGASGHEVTCLEPGLPEIHAANDKSVPAGHVPPAPVNPVAPPAIFAPQPMVASYTPYHRPKPPGFFARLSAALGFSRAPARYPTATAPPAYCPAPHSLHAAGGAADATAATDLSQAVTGAGELHPFTVVPPAPNAVDSVPAIAAEAEPAEFPVLADHEPAPLAAPSSVPVPSLPSDSAPVAEAEDPFQLPTITPAGNPKPEAAAQDSSTRQVSHQPEHEEKFQQIAARNGSGFKGFCPVVLRDQRELADAKAEFQSTFESITYQFSSAEAQARFDAQPEKYAPIRGGKDSVKAASGEETDGSIEHAVWFKDRLYLFSSRDSLRRFMTEPARFAGDE